MASSPGIEVFCTGDHRGKPYTPADMADILRNFQQFSSGPGAILRVPLVIGHDEDQSWLRRSNLPAAGWATRLATGRGQFLPPDVLVLLADAEDVPAEVARLIRARAYRKISAEVYDLPPPGVNGRGKMLRRIAILGADIPAIKGLADIPMPEGFSEGRAEGRAARVDTRPVRCGILWPEGRRAAAVQSAPGLWAVFSEIGGGMDRAKLLEALAKAGFNTSGITDMVPDPLLAEILRVCEGKSGQPGGDGPPGQEGGFNDPKDQAEAQKMNDHAMRYMEHCRKHMERFGGSVVGGVNAAPGAPGGHVPATVSGGVNAAPGAPGGMPQRPATVVGGANPPGPSPYGERSNAMSVATAGMFSEAQVSEAVAKAFSAATAGLEATVQKAVEAATAKIAAQQAQFDSFREESVKLAQSRSVDETIQRLDLAGKLPPAEHAAARELMLLLAQNPAVQKFTEEGKEVERTALAHYIATLDRRPRLFTELARGGSGGKPGSASEEAAKVKEHFEAYSEQFSRAETTEEDLLKAFEAARKIDPKLTAEAFLGRHGFAARAA
jgi:hypothetical protein